uniref:Uncharacterized protein n=1 Tax=Anopheles funestus TaxID=62324 RepID=A0A182RVR7_ANOFN
MGRILLQNLQNIFDEMISIQKRSKINRRIEYGVKNIVKKVKVQVERNNGTAVPLDIDLAVVNFDVDFQEQITEKEVIYSLSCNNGTTVKNVEDITMRDAPHPEDYSSQVQLTEDNDFGETMPTEMLDFLYSNDEPEVHPAIEKNPEPATLDDMDIDLSVEADVDMGNNSNHM